MDAVERDVLIIFSSPAQNYVTPKFYTTTNPDMGKVVPTWIHAAVQIYGRGRVSVDSKSDPASDFLASQTHDLAKNNEENIMGYTIQGKSPGAWKVSNAPD